MYQVLPMLGITLRVSLALMSYHSTLLRPHMLGAIIIITAILQIKQKER